MPWEYEVETVSQWMSNAELKALLNCAALKDWELFSQSEDRHAGQKVLRLIFRRRRKAPRKTSKRKAILGQRKES